MWWPFRRKAPPAAVRGARLKIADSARSIERHETVIERLGIALAKERHGRRRPDRIAGYEAELRRHLECLAQQRQE